MEKPTEENLVFESEIADKDYHEIIRQNKNILGTFFSKLEIAFTVFFLVSCVLVGILFSKIDNVISQLGNQQAANIVLYRQNNDTLENQRKALTRLQIISDRQTIFYNRAVPKEQQIIIHEPVVINRIVKNPVRYIVKVPTNVIKAPTNVMQKPLTGPCHVSYTFFINNHVPVPPCAYVKRGHK